MKKPLIAAIVGVALVALVVASLVLNRDRDAQEVYAETVERRSIARVVKASGQIDPRVKVNISAPLIGKIEKLYVEEGDWIEEGEPFLDLEKEAFRAAKESASAQLSIARSQLRQSEINLKDSELKLRRAERLTEERILSASDLEAAMLDYRSQEIGREQARESVLQARASLDKAVDDLEKTTIFAPLSGRVVTLNAEEGEVVVSGTMNNPASVIGTIADLSEILAEVDVDETEVAFLSRGQQAAVRVDALTERRFDGQVVEIGSSGFQRPSQPDVTFFKAKVLLREPGEGLRPGMSCRAEITTAQRDGVLVVPIQAVVQRESESTEEEVPVVFVVDEGRARRVGVETGISDATHVEVRSGLEDGAALVTGPYRVLRDLEGGEEVRVETADGDDEE